MKIWLLISLILFVGSAIGLAVLNVPQTAWLEIALALFALSVSGLVVIALAVLFQQPPQEPPFEPREFPRLFEDDE